MEKAKSKRTSQVRLSGASLETCQHGRHRMLRSKSSTGPLHVTRGRPTSWQTKPPKPAHRQAAQAECSGLVSAHPALHARLNSCCAPPRWARQIRSLLPVGLQGVSVCSTSSYSASQIGKERKAEQKFASSEGYTDNTIKTIQRAVKKMAKGGSEISEGNLKQAASTVR